MVVVVVVVVVVAAMVVAVAMAVGLCVLQVSTGYQLSFESKLTDMRLCRVTLQPEEVSFRV